LGKTQNSMPSALKLNRLFQMKKSSTMSPAVINHLKEHDDDLLGSANKSPLGHDSLSTLATEFSPESTTSSPTCDIRLLREELPALPFESEVNDINLDKAVLPRKSSMKKPGIAPRLATVEPRGRVIENFLPGKLHPVRRRLSVVFDETVKVTPITPIRDLLENHQDLWFQADEFEKIRNKARLLVHKVNNNLTQGKNYCVRGLEGYLNPQVKQRIKGESLDIVLDEQDLQFHNGTFDENRIARSYMLAAAQSKKEALRRAEFDEDDALIYHRMIQS